MTSAATFTRDMEYMTLDKAKLLTSIACFMQEYADEMPMILARYRGSDLDRVLVQIGEHLFRIRNENLPHACSMVDAAALFRKRNPQITETLDRFQVVIFPKFQK